MGLVSLIVMEPGSPWPGPIADSDHVVALGHDTDALLERTRHLVEALRGRREQVQVAVLACNDATDVASSGRRAEIAHELLGAVTPVAMGRLILRGADRASMRLRHELMSLAGSLTPELQGTRATVSVHFGVETAE
jgi:hypothetical protein